MSLSLFLSLSYTHAEKRREKRRFSHGDCCPAFREMDSVRNFRANYWKHRLAAYPQKWGARWPYRRLEWAECLPNYRPPYKPSLVTATELRAGRWGNFSNDRVTGSIFEILSALFATIRHSNNDFAQTLPKFDSHAPGSSSPPCPLAAPFRPPAAKSR